MIYLGSPYTHQSKEVMEQRYIEACKVSAKLMLEGKRVFSPIAHSHAIAQHGLPIDNHAFWMYQDAWFLDHCESMMVLKLPGWAESRGLRHEIETFEALDKPIEYMGRE